MRTPHHYRTTTIAPNRAQSIILMIDTDTTIPDAEKGYCFKPSLYGPVFTHNKSYNEEMTEDTCIRILNQHRCDKKNKALIGGWCPKEHYIGTGPRTITNYLRCPVEKGRNIYRDTKTFPSKEVCCNIF